MLVCQRVEQIVQQVFLRSERALRRRLVAERAAREAQEHPQGLHGRLCLRPVALDGLEESPRESGCECRGNEASGGK